MGMFTYVLRKAKATVNGYEVGVQTQNRAYYSWFIRKGDDWYKYPRSGFTFTSWQSALSAGKKEAEKITEQIKS